MTRPRLTVLVPCKNERHNLGPCLDSFRQLADEVLIADSGSTDGTLEYVRSRGCRVIEREYRTSGDFKNWAIPQASHDWVLLLDADERLSPALAAEIRTVLEAGPRHDGYWIYRANHFMGHPIRWGDLGKDVVLRLFRRDLARYQGPSDHGEVQIATGNVGTLRERMPHFACWSYDQWFAKFHRYTTLQARQWYEAGRGPSFWRLLLHAPARFLRDYVLKLGFLDGRVGLQLALLASFYSFTKQARLWELHHAQAPPQEASSLSRMEQAA